MSRIFAPLGILALAGFVLVPLPEVAFLSRHPLFGQVLENTAHPVVFAMLAWVAHQAFGRPGYVWLLAALLGAATELVQHFIGRDASWLDLGNDALGAGLALFWPRACRGPRRTLWRSGAAVLVLAAAAPMLLTLLAYGHRALDFPLLWQQEHYIDRIFVRETGIPFPGFSLDEPTPDWRGFRALQLEVENPADTPVEVTLRVHDGQHRLTYTDRYNETFRLGPRSRQRIEVPLSQIEQAPQGRLMDLSDIRGVMLFRQAADRAHTVTVRAIRLSR